MAPTRQERKDADERRSLKSLLTELAKGNRIWKVERILEKYPHFANLRVKLRGFELIDEIGKVPLYTFGGPGSRPLSQWIGGNVTQEMRLTLLKAIFMAARKAHQNDNKCASLILGIGGSVLVSVLLCSWIYGTGSSIPI